MNEIDFMELVKRHRDFVHFNLQKVRQQRIFAIQELNLIHLKTKPKPRKGQYTYFQSLNQGVVSGKQNFERRYVREERRERREEAETHTDLQIQTRTSIICKIKCSYVIGNTHIFEYIGA